MAGLAIAFQTTFAMVAVTRPTTGGGFSQYNLYKFVPANIDYFEKIPPLPVGLPAPCARPGVLYHFSSHYQVTDKTCFFYIFFSLFQVVVSGALALKLVTSVRIYERAQEGVLRCPRCHITFLSSSPPAALQEHLGDHLDMPSSAAQAQAQAQAA